MKMKNSACKVLVGKRAGEKPPGRSRRIFKDNIKMYLIEIGWEIVDLIHLAEDSGKWRAVVSTVMNFLN
jgi:hypothetical protein